eukprot:TRINITY_DN43807_c0_g1_i1.p1 TRINITY_DN43807_c0_g1~~TRINITY_DN43807_c0_g1_i1.p1  ORF type:complete len:449 (+),score=78.00 TRINITY_DN43807_c0_g1_i1:64-1410(+)
MGSMLSTPVELIRVQRSGSTFFRSAVAEMQGFRRDHEDAHEMRCDGPLGSFWVLDGHGGSFAANYGAPGLVQEFEAARQEGGGSLPRDDRIETGFRDVDAQLFTAIGGDCDKESGSTVIGTLIERTANGSYALKLMNAGDSRALVVRGPEELQGKPSGTQVTLPEHLQALVGQEHGPQPLAWPLIAESVDHKPNHPTEKARVLKAGGSVTEEEPPRVDGNLAVSRGLGDFEFKSDKLRPVAEQKISCIPDIYEVKGLKTGTICVLCCDGVWDVMDGQFVGCFVRDWLDREPEADLGEICTELVRLALRKNSRDNVTVMVVHFVDGSDWASETDEIKNFESYSSKLATPSEMDDEVMKHYVNFLKRTGFTPDPRPCGVCNKWMKEMQQCPCKTVFYCNKSCQKKGWKCSSGKQAAHKRTCPFAGSSAAETAISVQEQPNAPSNISTEAP